MIADQHLHAKTYWNAMYQKPLERIPWEIEEPPKELIELIESKAIVPSRALDVACGTGNYSIYLAKLGCEVTGQDFSPIALKQAREKAKASNVNVHFVECGALKLTEHLTEQFDFILDYSFLHHVSEEEVAWYVNQFPTLLKPHGTLLLVCYSEKYEAGQGHSKAVGKYGNTMYFRSANMIRSIYKGLKESSYKPARLGKRHQHPGHCFVFERN